MNYNRPPLPRPGYPTPPQNYSGLPPQNMQNQQPIPMQRPPMQGQPMQPQQYQPRPSANYGAPQGRPNFIPIPSPTNSQPLSAPNNSMSANTPSPNLSAPNAQNVPPAFNSANLTNQPPPTQFRPPQQYSGPPSSQPVPPRPGPPPNMNGPQTNGPPFPGPPTIGVPNPTQSSEDGNAPTRPARRVYPQGTSAVSPQNMIPPIQQTNQQFSPMQNNFPQQQQQPPPSQFMPTPAPPQFGSAQQVQHLNNIYGVPPSQQQNQPQQQMGLVSQMGAMSISQGGGSMHPGFLPTTKSGAMNLSSRPPNMGMFSYPEGGPWISPSSSVSGSPFSNSPAEYKRCTINAVPQTSQLLAKSKLPFALLVTPYRSLLPGDDEVPVINPEQIVRCRRCRAYINPWVQFIENGTKWKCSLCYVTNEVPSFFDWDPETRQPRDRLKRFELSNSVVEFVAPQEYMVRPPQPVVLVFLIDVSYSAVQSGMVATAARTILDTLDMLPNEENRTRVAVITVDSSLHFYNLNPNLSEPKMMVVADFDEPYLPLPDDLLVNLTDSKAMLEMLLERLPGMFAATKNVQCAMGPGLQACYKLMSPIGGKVIMLQSTLPNVGEGTLKAREDVKLIGTAKEYTLHQPSIHFYKNMAVDFSRSQMSVDIFLFNSLYSDIATQSGLAKFTGGTVYYYPGFNASRQEDAEKFSTEFSHFLSRPIGLEAVLRIRASRGIRLTTFHGSFFLRSTDLMAIPNVSPDNAYGVEMAIEEPITSSIVCFQTALLHTSSNGERRIRVITLAVPTTANLADVIASADQVCIAALLVKKGIERALVTKIEDARDALVYKLVEILGTYKQNFTTSGQSSLLLAPENLSLLPVLTLGMLKNLSFRPNAVPSSDIRSYMMLLLYILSPEMVINMIHPKFYALHNLAVQDDSEGLQLPIQLNLSSEKLERNGLYLLSNGLDIYIWVGRGIDPQLCLQVFGRDYESIVIGKTTLPPPTTPMATQITTIVNSIKQVILLQATISPNVIVVKEDGDQILRKMFLMHLIEDWSEGSYSYPQWVAYLKEQLGKFDSA
ncbi:COPII subunit [Nowakowskiella sp. JEL0407]|nr:COPII subunit [Nowakowskiella sp. JEL0407]